MLGGGIGRLIAFDTHAQGVASENAPSTVVVATVAAHDVASGWCSGFALDRDAGPRGVGHSESF